MQPTLPSNLCLGCMSDNGGAAACPHCGWAAGTPSQGPLYLNPGTILREQYVVGRVLGHGGFGITYLGWDLNLARRVAIKEYFPGGVGIRATGDPKVFAYSPTLSADYDWGLERYLEEARVVARFENHPNIVWVLNFFPANGTAYIVLEYLDGITFEKFLEGQVIDWTMAQRILTPVCDALREVHRVGLLHRDVSPDNIYLLRTGQVKVIDFGAARYSLGQHSKNLSVILKPGFAPPEQYQTRGNQGPWTDVYATACTYYRALTGHIPPPAPDRLAHDELVPPSRLGVAIPPEAERALLRALSLDPAQRFADMAEFQQALRGELPVPNPAPRPPDPAPVPSQVPSPVPIPPPPPKPVLKPGLPKWLLGVAGGVAALVGLVAVLPKNEPKTGPVVPPVVKVDPRPRPVSNDDPVPGPAPPPDPGPAPPSPGPTPAPNPGPGPGPGPARAEAPRVLAFEFTPSQVQFGQSTQLHWETKDAAKVFIDGRPMAVQGTIEARPSRSASATLTAEGPGGKVQATAILTVVEPPPRVNPVEILRFSASPVRIRAGQGAMLYWSSRGAVSARIAPEPGDVRVPSGNVRVSPRQTTRYVLEMTGAGQGNVATQQVEVEVVESDPAVVSRDDPRGNPREPVAANRGWQVYHHHGLMLPNLNIDWGQVSRGRVDNRGAQPQCHGTLTLNGDHLRFDSLSSNDGFDVPLADVEKVETNRTRIGGYQSFQVKLRGGRNYNFVPRQPAIPIVNAINAKR
ncbi:MAG: serine/threonine-protein kinase [Bryobacteraceae bacterium]